MGGIDFYKKVLYIATVNNKREIKMNYLNLCDDMITIRSVSNKPNSKYAYEVKLLDEIRLTDIIQFNEQLHTYVLEKCLVNYMTADIIKLTDSDNFGEIILDFSNNNKLNNFKIYRQLFELMQLNNKYQQLRETLEALPNVEFIYKSDDKLVIMTSKLNFILDYSTLEYKYCAYPENEIYHNGEESAYIEDDIKKLQRLITYRDEFIKIIKDCYTI